MLHTEDNKDGSAAKGGIHLAMPLILFAAAAFLFICFITENTGFVGRSISRFLLGLFSYAAYVIPAFLLLHAVFFKSDRQKGRILTRVIFSLITLFMISATVSFVGFFDELPEFSPAAFYSDGKERVGGGFFGGLLAYGLIALIGKWGFLILDILVFAVYVTYFFSGERGILSKLGRILRGWTVRILTGIDNFFKQKKVLRTLTPKKAKKKDAHLSSAMRRTMSEDEFFSSDNRMKDIEIPALGISERKSDYSVEAKPQLQEKVRVRDKKEKFDDTPLPDLETSVNGESNAADTFGASVSAENTQSISDDDSERASDVFTGAFNPFDVAENTIRSERFASNAKPLYEYAEPEASQEDYEKHKRRSDFEKRREQLLRRNESEIRKPIEEADWEFASGFAPKDPEITEDKESTADKYTTVHIEEDGDFSVRPDTPTNEEKFEKTKSFDAETSFASPASDTEEEKPEEPLKLERTPIPEYSFEIEEEESPEFEEEDEADETDGDNSEYADAEDEEEYSADDTPIPPEEQNPQINAYRSMFSMFSQTEGQKSASAPAEEPICEKVPDEEEDLPPFDFDEDDVKEPAEEEKEVPGYKGSDIDYSDYVCPPLSLLAPVKESNTAQNYADIEINKIKLIDTIKSFGVEASVVGVSIGPRITRYEVAPARGVKVQSIINLATDISLALAADIRMEAPIPGKSAIGFEIPNAYPTPVVLRELIEFPSFLSSASKTLMCVGKDISGSPIYGDIAKMPHLLIAGATGMGKSVALNAMLLSILFRAKPDEVKLVMIDPKRVEFENYNGIPHMLVPVVDNVKSAAGTLTWAVDQMEERYALLTKFHVRNIEGYNEKVKADPSLGKPLPRMIIVIDELCDLMLKARHPVEDLIMSLTQKSRAAGIHMILGTQRPSVNVITGVIKANIPARLSCKVSNDVDSRTILNLSGAEKLLNNGDMLFLPVGVTKPIRVQGAFVSDGEVERVIEFLRSQAKGDVYDAEAIESIKKATQKCEKKGDSSFESEEGDSEDSGSGIGYLNDQKFLDACEIALKNNKISTSQLQRCLAIGFQKAARYIDIMEDLGLVGESNGSKPREVLMSKDEWHEKLSRTSLD